MSITMGISIYRPGISQEKLVAEEDSLLYEGKNSGKDHTVTTENETGCQ